MLVLWSWGGGKGLVATVTSIARCGYQAAEGWCGGVVGHWHGRRAVWCITLDTSSVFPGACAFCDRPCRHRTGLLREVGPLGLLSMWLTHHFPGALFCVLHIVPPSKGGLLVLHATPTNSCKGSVRGRPPGVQGMLSGHVHELYRRPLSCWAGRGGVLLCNMLCCMLSAHPVESAVQCNDAHHPCA
jgi:hypothetical protein